MADNIVGGLFGVDPSMLQRQQQAREFNQDFQAVQLSPMEQSKLAILQGTRAFGKGVGSLLGMEDPELAKASKIKQIASQIDYTTPEGLRELAVAIKDFAPKEAAMAAAEADKRGLTQAQTSKALREQRTPSSPLGKLIAERDDLIAGGMDPKDPRIQAYNKTIAASGESNAPRISLDLKMLDAAAGRRKTFLDENKPLVEQGAAIGQALTLISADTPFSQAAFENTVVSAFGGDKQKSVKEIQRLVNTGSFDQRVENSLKKFATGKIGDVTQEDQKNILEAVQGDLKRRYNSRRDSTINASRNVKELQGQEDYMAPTWEETVGGGAAAGKKAFTVGETFKSPKFGTLEVLEVDREGNPIKVRDSKGKIGTLKGMK